MRTRCIFRWPLLVGFLIAFHLCSIQAQEAGGSVRKRGVIADDLYVTGGRVDVLAEVDGDVIAAGGQTSIGHLVRGDVMAAGGQVTVTGQILDDVRVAGGTITIGANIGGDVVVAGGSVSLEPETEVSGRAWLTGGKLEIHGSIGKELKAAARRITLGGQVEGDVHLTARSIKILPTVRIKGNLIYRSPRSAKIDSAAQIGGEVKHHRSDVVGKAARVTRVIIGTGSLLILLGLMVTGVIVFVLFSTFTVSAARTIGGHPWQSLGLGFVLLVATPIAGCLLMATIIGIPLGLAVCALYGVVLLLGFLTAAFFLGDLGARLWRRELEVSKGWRVVSLIVALLMLGLLRLIPIAGPVILFCTLLFGLGAWSIHGYRTYAGTNP